MKCALLAMLVVVVVVVKHYHVKIVGFAEEVGNGKTDSCPLVLSCARTSPPFWGDLAEEVHVRDMRLSAGTRLEDLNTRDCNSYRPGRRSVIFRCRNRLTCLGPPFGGADSAAPLSTPP
ncbi:hypothetical protein Vafri_21845 [Volvox africanus]|uniref:Secreted protein n=1 Tax=Volvox africanus TaxID=51714 RepID=A0A8J4FBR9_9CHLO|nr:hypothetical protein Vafri_21845 [Volvox africanus]